jgi:hypothetical protein
MSLVPGNQLMGARPARKLVLERHDHAGEHDEEGDEAIERGVGSLEKDHRAHKRPCDAGQRERGNPPPLAREFAAIPVGTADVSRPEGDAVRHVRSLGAVTHGQQGGEAHQRTAAGNGVNRPGCERGGEKPNSLKQIHGIETLAEPEPTRQRTYDAELWINAPC